MVLNSIMILVERVLGMPLRDTLLYTTFGSGGGGPAVSSEMMDCIMLHFIATSLYHVYWRRHNVSDWISLILIRF